MKGLVLVAMYNFRITMIQKEIPFHLVQIINMPTRVPLVNYLSVSDSQNVALSPLRISVLQHKRELKYLEKQKNPDNQGVGKRQCSIQESWSEYVQLNPSWLLQSPWRASEVCPALQGGEKVPRAHVALHIRCLGTALLCSWL